MKHKTLVIDHGSNTTKFGFTGTDCCTEINELITVAGRYSSPYVNIYSGQRSIFVGKDAKRMRGLLHLDWPIQKNTISNWDSMEQIWKWIFDPDHELKHKPSDFNHPILITKSYSPHNKNEYAKIAEIMFEKLNIPSLYTEVGEVLSLYSWNKRTGIVLDSGYQDTRVVPIHESHVIEEAVQRQDIGGMQIDWEYVRRCRDRGYSFVTATERDIVTDIKEKLFYVALDYDTEQAKYKTTKSMECKYELPDGQQIWIGNERFSSTELIFEPQSFGNRFGIHKALYSCAAQCGSLIDDLLSNVVVCGGNSLLNGFDERLVVEFDRFKRSKKTKEQLNILKMRKQSVINGYLREMCFEERVYDDITTTIQKLCEDWLESKRREKRKYSAFIGGALFASLSNFEELCVNKTDYEENGIR
eukprot:558790_1